jgi:ferredoxin
LEDEFNDKHIMGIAFPIAALGTYPICWEFLNKLPRTNATQAFMVDTLAEFSGGIIGPVREILRKKGFTTIGAKQIRMPSNYFVEKKREEKNNQIIRAGKKEAQKFVKDIISGNSKWGRMPGFSDLLSFPSKSGNAWKLMRRLASIRLNKQACTKCSLCEEACPVNNIDLEPYPIIKKECQLCQKCVGVCPTEALICAFSKKSASRFFPYRAKGIKAEELID